MSLAQRIDEFTLWLLNDHRSRMNLVRQYLWRQARNRAHAEQRHTKRQRRIREDAELPIQRPAAPERDIRDLLAQHRAWNAHRARGGVRHFG